MKSFKLKKGIQLVLVTLIVVIIGAIIVGVTSNNETLAARKNCTFYWKNEETADPDDFTYCTGTMEASNLDANHHIWTCNTCGNSYMEDCQAGSTWFHKSGTSVHQKFCWACGYFRTQANCSDSDGDGACDAGCGNYNMHTHSYSSTTYEENDSSTHSIIKKCSCGDTKDEGTESHSFGAWSNAGSSGHSASCSKCGYDKTESHNSNETIPGVEATCTTAGKTEGKKCSVCGEVTQAQTDVEALGHTEEEIPGVEATCTTAGKTAGKKCSVCGEVTQAQTDVEALGHIEEEIPAVEATCTTEGKTSGKKCSVCKTVTQEPTTVPATGHNYENGTCTGCGEEEPTTEIEITSTTYKIEETYIYVQPSTKVIDFKSNITTNATEIKAYENDEEVDNDKVFTTGMSIELKTGNINKTFTIIVKGDVNSDGTADFKDLVKINKARLNKITLEEIYSLAADVIEDDSLDLKDLSKINRFRLNKITEL